MDRKEIKAKAKEFAFSHKWAIWKPILVIALISGLIGGITNGILQFDPTTQSNELTLSTTIITLVLCVLNVGQIFYLRKVIHGKEVTIKEDLFHFFPNYIGIFVPMLVCTLLTSLTAFTNVILPEAGWASIVSLIAAVAEIIFTFMYAQVPLILSEDKKENFGGVTSLKMSREMMNGYKWDYFCLYFSFIGWFILCIFIVPIIWVIPWVATARVMYYEELKKVSK